jgi:hypothetical protein
VSSDGHLVTIKEERHMNLLRMVVGAAVSMVPIAQLEADPVQPAVGMYALESRPVVAGSTCVINIFRTSVVWEIPFSHLYYSGSTATSTLYATDNNAGGSDPCCRQFESYAGPRVLFLLFIAVHPLWGPFQTCRSVS